MKKLYVHLCIASLVLGSVPCTFSQDWHRLPWAVSGRFSNYFQENPLSAYAQWATDPSNSTISIPANGEVIVSTDSGRTFFSVQLPVTRPGVGYGQSTVQIADTRTIIVQSENISAPRERWAVMSRDGGLTFDSLLIQGRFSQDKFPVLHVRDAQLIATTINDSKVRSVLVSTDLGTTWCDSLRLAGTYDQYFDGADDGHVYVTDSTGATVWTDGSCLPTHRALPKGTRWYRSFDSLHLIAQCADGSQRLSLKTSSDGGDSWSTTDTIHCGSADTSFPVERMTVLRRDACVNCMTIRGESGWIVSTTDAGSTWIYRGTTPNESSMATSWTHSNGLTLLSSSRNGYWILPAGSTESVHHVESSPAGLPLQISPSHLLLANAGALFKSTDGGVTWFIMGDEIQTNHQPLSLYESGLQPYDARRLWWGPDGRLWTNAVFRKISLGEYVTSNLNKILSFTHPATSSPRWFYRGNDDFDPIAPMNEQGVLRSQRSTASRMLARIQTVPGGSAPSGRIDIVIHPDSLPRTLSRAGASFVWQLSTGEIYVVADSLLRSDDTGRSWSSVASTGFPTDSGNRTLIATSFFEAPNGLWYVGTSGVIIRDSSYRYDSSAIGGVLRSTDRGRSWQRIPGFPRSSHILNLVTDSSGILLAVTTKRVRNLRSSPNLWEGDSPASIYRVSQDSAVVVFQEKGLELMATTGRVIRRDHANNLYYASMNKGLLRSTDAGMTWLKFGAGMLDTLRVFDVIVDSTDRLFVGTSNGVYVYDPTTNVNTFDGPTTPSPILQCYPSPTSSVLHVRLHADSRYHLASSTLSLCTIVGEQVYDLSPTLRNALANDQFEFDVDLSTLPSGVYGLTYTDEGKSSMQKVLIAR